MAEWRFLRSWSESELESKLEALRGVERNFTAEGSWRKYFTQAMIGLECPGPPLPDGIFERAWRAIRDYHFSDPGIVTAHFDPDDPFEGRTFLLELKVLGLHYLCGTRIVAVHDERKDGQTWRGFRYDTLEGHLEEGSEWFMLAKDERTGQISFSIHASWRPGRFPNFWSRLGFAILGQYYQLAWHRLAYLRLREIVGSRGTSLAPVPRGRKLIHTGADVIASDLWVLTAPRASTRVRELGTGANPSQSLESLSDH